jgi:hypothetical protein
MNPKVFCATIIFILSFYSAISSDNKINLKDEIRNWKPDFSFVRETLYTFKSSWMEVNLATQTGTIHTADSVFSFGISTGNPKLHKSVETKEGVFVVQSRLPKLHSIQFDSTLMINWIGFNWGIGFHALAGNGYYSYLGKKKSSHGCVRISRESSKALYDKVQLGTPVIVHSGNSAITIAFGDSTKRYKYLNYSLLKREIDRRLNNLYSGKGDWNLPKLLIDRGNVFNDGLNSGESLMISRYQNYNYWAALHRFSPSNDFLTDSRKTDNFPEIKLR